MQVPLALESRLFPISTTISLDIEEEADQYWIVWLLTIVSVV